jgi:hypothetical protein
MFYLSGFSSFILHFFIFGLKNLRLTNGSRGQAQLCGKGIQLIQLNKAGPIGIKLAENLLHPRRDGHGRSREGNTREI